MSTHTPGPWIVQNLSDGHNGYDDWQTFCVRGPENVHIATVGDVDHYKAARIPANARLIAAAPRMLDIIRDLVSSPAMVDNDEPMMQEARAILREVEGESNG